MLRKFYKIREPVLNVFRTDNGQKVYYNDKFKTYYQIKK
jgi:hypothetical protein